MSQTEFITAMTTALGRRPQLDHGRQPSEADLSAYFATLSGNPEGAIAAYESYAQAFYVHISSIGSGRGDVPSPDGRWSSIRGLRRHGSGGQQRRITDCEGYAFIGRQLLTAAGWSFAGYRIVYRPLPPGADVAQLEYHIMAELSHPDHASVFVGHARVSSSAIEEFFAVFPTAGEYRQVRGRFDTDGEALQAAQADMESGSFREAGLLRPRARGGAVPPPVRH